MLINGREYAFKALYQYAECWHLTESVFFSQEEVEVWRAKQNPVPVIWPVEEIDGGIVYVPNKEDLEDTP